MPVPNLTFPPDLTTARTHVCKIDVLEPPNTNLNAFDRDSVVQQAVRNIGSVLGNLGSLFNGDVGATLSRGGVVDFPRDAHGIERRTVLSSLYLPVPTQLTQGAQNHTIDSAGALLPWLQVGNKLATIVTAAAQRSVNLGNFVVYQTPEFKAVDYTWTLVPRNASESQIIRHIVYWLGYYSTPMDGSDPGDGGAINAVVDAVTIRWPNEFRISFVNPENDQERVFNPPNKTGFIKSLEINYYDDSGNPTTFFENSMNPVVTVIKFTLQENELTFRRDFSNWNITQRAMLPEVDVRVDLDPVEG